MELRKLLRRVEGWNWRVRLKSRAPSRGERLCVGQLPAGTRCWRHGRCRFAHMRLCRGEVSLRIGAHAHLHQPDNLFALSDRHSSLNPEVDSSASCTRPTPASGIGPDVLLFANPDSATATRAGACGDYSSNKNCRGDCGCPQTTLVAHCRLRDIACAHDLV